MIDFLSRVSHQINGTDWLIKCCSVALQARGSGALLASSGKRSGLAGFDRARVGRNVGLNHKLPESVSVAIRDVSHADHVQKLEFDAVGMLRGQLRRLQTS